MKPFQQTATVLSKCVLPITLVAVSFLFISKHALAVDPDFACGGKVEKEVWELWDRDVEKNILERQLQDRLVKHGDVYALYDFQTYSHNLVAMARRCNRTSRLHDITRLIEVAYDKLELPTPGSAGRRWVCRGGGVCNDKNRLLNREVILDSLQFLGVASSVANALVLSNTQLDDNDMRFVKNTVQVVIEHLLRLSDKANLNAIQNARRATAPDFKKKGGGLYFTDISLWQISLYSDLAGIMNNAKPLGIPQIAPTDKAQLSCYLSELLQFFKTRLSTKHKQNRWLGDTDFAELDRGYWSFHADNAYAGYEKADKPVMCVYSGTNKSKFRIRVVVPSDKVLKRQDLGWDISHARRLVHALDSLERNRQSLKKIFNLKEEQLPPANITNAFANTLVGLVWNGNKNTPLFSNYLNGANGWYRVAYDNGTGQCQEGVPPFGLSDSFPTGGYVTWAKYNPKIGELGKQLYHLINSTKPDDIAFVDRYYEQFGTSANSINYSLMKIMFLPSLVGGAIK